MSASTAKPPRVFLRRPCRLQAGSFLPLRNTKLASCVLIACFDGQFIFWCDSAGCFTSGSKHRCDTTTGHRARRIRQHGGGGGSCRCAASAEHSGRAIGRPRDGGKQCNSMAPWIYSTTSIVAGLLAYQQRTVCSVPMLHKGVWHLPLCERIMW